MEDIPQLSRGSGNPEPYKKEFMWTLHSKLGCWSCFVKVPVILVAGYYTFFYPLIEYDRTFVEWQKPVTAGCIFGVLAAALLAKRIKRPLGFLGAAFVAAFMFCSVLFILNDVFSDGKQVEHKLAINAKYSRYLKSGPHAMVKFRNKQLSINAANEDALKQASYAVITVDKGLFGYDIIRGERLVKE
jgi:hypothetical protein